MSARELNAYLATKMGPTQYFENIDLKTLVVKEAEVAKPTDSENAATGASGKAEAKRSTGPGTFGKPKPRKSKNGGEEETRAKNLAVSSTKQKASMLMMLTPMGQVALASAQHGNLSGSSDFPTNPYQESDYSKVVGKIQLSTKAYDMSNADERGQDRDMMKFCTKFHEVQTEVIKQMLAKKWVAGVSDMRDSMVEGELARLQVNLSHFKNLHVFFVWQQTLGSLVREKRTNGKEFEDVQRSMQELEANPERFVTADNIIKHLAAIERVHSLCERQTNLMGVQITPRIKPHPDDKTGNTGFIEFTWPLFRQRTPADKEPRYYKFKDEKARQIFKAAKTMTEEEAIAKGLLVVDAVLVDIFRVLSLYLLKQIVY